MKRILYITATGALLFVALSIGFIYIKDQNKSYVLGGIIVGLKSYDDDDLMNEFIRSHPELSIKRAHENFPSYSIKVPKRKEQYWIGEFLKQEFVRYAELNTIGHINN